MTAGPPQQHDHRPGRRGGGGQAYRYPARICIQSRECSPQLLERLTGATLFPERSAGAAIVNTVRRGGGRLLYVTAPAMVEADRQVDYYLGLLPPAPLPAGPAPLPGSPGSPGPRSRAARAAVRIVSLDDSSPRWLSEKIQDPANPEAARVRAAIAAFAEREKQHGADLVLSYFEPSAPLERLAGELGVPGDQIHSCHIPLGTKDAGRRLLRQAGLAVPAGSPLCHSTAELAAHTARLLLRGHRKFVVKLNSTAYGGGLGNALLDLTDLAPPPAESEGEVGALAARILPRLPHATLVDPKLTWRAYDEALRDSGAIVEELIEGDDVRSPSFQGRITAGGTVHAVSTHDQVLTTAAQSYTGCSFPADAAYRRTIVDHGLSVGRTLAQRGVHGGDYGVDFLARRTRAGWQVLGCELNLRATATKHGFDLATGLLGTRPAPDGRLLIDGEERVYQASDGIIDPRYRGLRPAQLIHALTTSPLRYDPARHSGVVLHMMSAAPRYGKFGAVCIGRDQAESRHLMQQLRDLIAPLTPQNPATQPPHPTPRPPPP